jgi:hypothetical protein
MEFFRRRDLLVFKYNKEKQEFIAKEYGDVKKLRRRNIRT